MNSNPWWYESVYLWWDDIYDPFSYLPSSSGRDCRPMPPCGVSYFDFSFRGDPWWCYYPLLLAVMPPPREKEKDPECFAQLKYRPVDHAIAEVVGATHSYWWVQYRDGNKWIISAGPSPDGTGKLRTWKVFGDTNGKDNKDPTTAFDSGLLPENCDMIDQMMNAASWLDLRQVDYNPTGPNSSTAARHIGNRAGFYPSRPPGAIGWDTRIP